MNEGWARAGAASVGDEGRGRGEGRRSGSGMGVMRVGGDEDRDEEKEEAVEEVEDSEREGVRGAVAAGTPPGAVHCGMRALKGRESSSWEDEEGGDEAEAGGED